MKVLWITSAYPSERHPGSGVFHETQVQALVRSGLEVTVICPVPTHAPILQYLKKQYRLSSDVPLAEERKGVMVYRPPYPAMPGQLRWSQPDRRIAKSILKTMSEFQIQPDIIHAHFAMPSGGATRIVANERKLPWVLTLHGSDVNVYPSYSSSAMKAFLQAFESADQVLSVADHLRRNAMKLTGKSSVVLPIGIDLSRFKEPEQTKLSIRRKLQLPENKRIIVFVGRLVESKGVFELSQALDLLSDDMAVVFVGEGPAKEKLRKHQDFNKRLFLTGQVDNERVRDYLFSADVFALPSYSEGMPTVVIEALALEVPVVSTAVGDVPELFSDCEHLLVKKKSVTDLAERIVGYLDKGLYSPEIKQKLLKKVQKEYDAKQNARKLQKIYQKTIESVRLNDRELLL